MFVYLSKKIAIPNNVKLNCISWNKEHGYIAAAGTEGLLKVLKLEQAAASNGQNKGTLAAISNLSLNQTLDGHKGEVKVVVWNDVQQKLTSSDVNGVIMVWMLYKGSWYEEMTNDRKKSTVSGMHWSSDGTKICIVYDDGAIIVGSVDGNRLWGKELKNTHLSGVQWSPDNRLLLFSLHTGECHVYDNEGNFVMKLDIKCVNLMQNSSSSSCQNRIAALCWFSGSKSMVAPMGPTLAICYSNGKCQLMINENDEDPILLDCGMYIADAKWNHDGTVLAIGGTLNDLNVTKESTLSSQQQVAFYSAWGHLYRILKVPGSEISSISWEGKSLRLAMAVDSFIYFANIRIDYTWCYFDKTIAFLKNCNSNNSNNNNSTIDQQKENTNLVTFWNTTNNQSFQKEVEPCLSMAAHNDHCVLGVECVNSNMKQLALTIMESNKNLNDKLYQVLLCNTIGTTVDSTYVDIRPKFLAMNSIYACIASHDEILLWHYHTPKSLSQLHNVKTRKEKRLHINDIPPLAAMDLLINKVEQLNALELNSNDTICALAVSETILLLARESGIIHEYTFPNIDLKSHYNVKDRIFKIAINCNSTRSALIDQSGTMTLLDLDLDDREANQLNFSRVERKDVWVLCWAKDNPLLLAFMEKTRMYVFRGNDPEEPIICSGYICVFEDLEITSVLLDDIISGDELQNSISHILQLKVKSLRDTDDLLQHVGLEDAKQYIEDNPHPRLWRLLAEAALKRLELNVAENAFVRCSHYPGIQLIKKLRNIPSGMLQKAEVAAFYSEYEEAEKLYIEADRRDLAINLRITLCDWFRVVELYRLGSGISDQKMETAWLEIGHHFATLRSWESAKVYYEKCQHIEGVMESLYNLEEFEELEKCIESIPEKNTLLLKLAKLLTSVGMCKEAIKAYLKYGDPKLALDTCISLHQWSLAIDLAKQYHMPEVSELVNEHTKQFLQDGRLQETIELQRATGHYFDAARLLMELAEQEVLHSPILLRIKKLYVLAGLLCEQYLKSLVSRKQYSSEDSTMHSFDRGTLIDSLNPADSSMIEHVWQCAEAYHFLLLAQQQLYFGITHSAVTTALRLLQYEHILNPVDIYSILALTSWADRSFNTCLYALEKLKSIGNTSEKDHQEYERLVRVIVSKYESLDDRIELAICYSCESSIADWLPLCPSCNVRFPPCISSGKSITQPTGHIWICGTCNHCALSVEINRNQTCPLCHSLIVSVPLEI